MNFFHAVASAGRVGTTPLLPLLDVYPGAGTALAIGVIKLRTAYTGACIRIRRASDNAESDIGFDANGVLNVATIAAFCSGTTGFVRTIYNQNGGTNHVVQTTTSRQPRIYQTGLVITDSNGLPAILGNGTSTGMTFTQIVADGDSVFGVFSTNNTNINMLLGSSNTDYNSLRTEVNEWRYGRVLNPYILGTPAGVVTINSGVTTNQHIFYVDFGNTDLEGSVDNVAGGTFTKYGTASINYNQFMATRIGLGGQYFMAGRTQLCIIYNGTMRTNATAIVNHLNTQMSVY